MTNHPRRNWRRKWTVDLASRTASHQSGLVVRFVRNPDGSWDGSAEPRELTAEERSDPHIASKLASLMREAGDVFREAIEKER